MNHYLDITVSMPTINGGNHGGSMQFNIPGSKEPLPIPVDAEQAAYMVDFPDRGGLPIVEPVAVNADTSSGMRFTGEQPPAREGYSRVVIVFFTHTIDYDQALVAVFRPSAGVLDANNGDWVEAQDGRDKTARFSLRFGRNLIGLAAETTETETA